MPTTTEHRAAGNSTADDDLAFAGLVRLGELLRRGQVTPRDLTEFYLARIERIDPTLGAFISVRAERALTEADAALERLRAGERGPLLGIPIALKDNVDLAAEVTTHGSRGSHEPAHADSEVVRRLRAASPIVLGKTALCELAACGHFTSSQAFGITRNPWKLDRSPCGSSGGSAVAVAAGLAPIALGSDGGGSIRIPAAFCGLFGLKPQRGRIPLAPLTDHWHGCTVLGGLGRSVLDVALVDDVIRRTASGPRWRPVGVGKLVRGGRRSRARAAADRRLDQTGDSRRQALTRGGRSDRANRRAAPFTWSRRARVQARPITVARDLHPAVGRRHPRGRPRARGGTRATNATDGGGRPAIRRSGAAVQHQAEPTVAARLNAVFDEHDLVMIPTTAGPPAPAEISRDAGAFRSFNQGGPDVCYTRTWNYVGQPAASIPAGFDSEGLPMAVQLAGPPSSETTILSLAAQSETARPWRDRRPELTNHQDVR